jgi:hypothetical protein
MYMTHNNNESSENEFLDVNNDGKVTLSESLLANAELLDTYAKNAASKKGVKATVARLVFKVATSSLRIVAKIFKGKK